MREIKFRAWDKMLCEMFEVYTLSKYEVYAIQQETEDMYKLNLSDCELMQSTGLKDKNGVEIYFDDLTRINNTIYRVIELNGAVAFVCPLTGAFWNYACNLATNKFGELAGNIYENPELLNYKGVN